MRSLSAYSTGIAVLVLVSLFFPATSRATVTVNTGWDLLATQPGTIFGGVAFQGSPLGTFNFGGGAQSVGNADTIVHRVSTGTGPTATVPVEMVALQLVSSAPTNFGLGVGLYYMTLQSARGGPATLGTETIIFGPEAPAGSSHGTFNSFFDVFFDIRLGSVSGPIALSSELAMTSSNVPWNHYPPSGAVLIPGVNVNLNGSNNGNDFWSIGSYLRVFPTGVQIVAPATTSVPDAGGTLGMALLAFVSCGLFRRRKSAGANG